MSNILIIIGAGALILFWLLWIIVNEFRTRRNIINQNQYLDSADGGGYGYDSTYPYSSGNTAYNSNLEDNRNTFEEGAKYVQVSDDAKGKYEETSYVDGKYGESFDECAKFVEGSNDDSSSGHSSGFFDSISDFFSGDGDTGGDCGGGGDGGGD